MHLEMIVRRVRSVLGPRCQTCGDRGYVVDGDVADFIAKNGLAAYQAASTLMTNEILYGGLGSVPVSAWEGVGLPEDQAELFVTDVSPSHVLHSCPTCKGQPNHEDALGVATSILNSLRENDRRRRAEWLAETAEERRRVRRFHRNRRMAAAIRMAQTSRDFLEEP